MIFNISDVLEIVLLSTLSTMFGLKWGLYGCVIPFLLYFLILVIIIGNEYEVR